MSMRTRESRAQCPVELLLLRLADDALYRRLMHGDAYALARGSGKTVDRGFAQLLGRGLAELRIFGSADVRLGMFDLGDARDHVTIALAGGTGDDRARRRGKKLGGKIGREDVVCLGALQGHARERGTAQRFTHFG